MRITLNLATRPFADLGPAIKRLRIGMGVLAVLSIGFGVGLHFFHNRAEAARARDHSLDGQLARVQRERQGYMGMMQQPANAQLLAQSGALNGLFERKTFSWTLAMEDLETVLPGGVQVASLEPTRDKDGHITLHMRVAGPRDLVVNLVQNLEHSHRFLSPRIVGENTASTEGQNRGQVQPVSASNRFDFDLLADYNPVPEPRTAKELSKEASKETEKKAEMKAAEKGAHPAAPRKGTGPMVGVPIGGGPVGGAGGPNGVRMPYAVPPRLPPARPKPNPGANPGGPQ
jgi:type IV pilus assembly protein PilN